VNRLRRAGQVAATVFLALWGHHPVALATPGVLHAANMEIAVDVGTPAGFEGLGAPQDAIVDVYVTGERRGTAAIRYRPGTLSFRDPAAVLGLLPPLKPGAARTLAEALSGQVESHVGNACYPVRKLGCGSLEPSVAGVIFDEANLRLDLFVNPGLLEPQSTFGASRHIPPPTEQGLTFYSPVSVFLGANNGPDGWDESLGFTSRSYLSKGAYSMKVETSYLDDSQPSGEQDSPRESLDPGFSLDNASVLHVRPGWLYEAGLQRTVGLDLTGGKRILGVSATTTTQTRIDLAQARGSQLLVYLPTRSTVDLLVNGRLISRRVYPAGNQMLDTEGLPEGGYNVTLRIQDSSGGVTEETRFFARSTRIPPVDQPTIILQAGMLVSDERRDMPDIRGIPIARVGTALRVASDLAVFADILTSDRQTVGSVGGTWMSRMGVVSATVLGSADGDYGGSLTAYGQLAGDLSYGVSAQILERSDKFEPGRDFDEDLLGESYRQASVSLSYPVTPRLDLSVRGYWRASALDTSEWAIGPRLSWQLFSGSRTNASIDAEITVGDNGVYGFVKLRLFQFGGADSRWSFNGAAGISSPAEGSSGHQGVAPVASAQAQWQDGDLFPDDLRATAGADLGPDRDATAFLSGEHDGPLGLATGEIQEHRARGGNLTTSLSASFSTALTLNRGGIALGGGYGNDAALLVRLRGTDETSRFDVLVNGQASGQIEGSGTLVIPVPAYNTYSVHLQPVGAASVTVDTAARKVTLYPGNTAELDWDAYTVVALFGRALGDDGAPLATAKIIGAEDFAFTDRAGYFQIDARPGTAITLRLPDGRDCTLDLPPASGGDAAVALYRNVGERRCRPIATPQDHKDIK